MPQSVYGVKIFCQSGMLFITLPSGRNLAYVKPRIGENRFGGESVTYEGIGGAKKWERLESYGPKFVENIVQATSRDLLMNAIKTLRGCSIVARVHDEVIIEADPSMSLLDKKRVPNNGLVPKYYVEGSHEAIIDKDTFLRVQAELARRSSIKTGDKKRTYSSKYALSSRVFCAHCGDIYRRIAWNNRGYRSIVWRCVSRVEKKKSGIDCPARTLREEDLQAAVVTAVNDAWSRKDSVLVILKENIRSVLDGAIEDKVAEVDKAIRDKQAELLEAGSDQSLIEDIGDAIINLREERQSILTEVALKHDLQERIEDLISFLDEQTEAVTEYSEPLARRLIEKITVYDEKLVVEFKSGLTVEVEA